MLKLVLQLKKIIISAILANLLLSVVCLAYGYNMLQVPSVVGASGCSEVPQGLISNMDEGFGWNVMDENGYNNDEVYDNVDILIMGGSHIEALQMNRSDNLTYKLGQLLPEYHVYNVGIALHTIELCANYLDNACSYFDPQYVVIDLNSLELDSNVMDSVLKGTFEGPDFYTDHKTWIKMIYNYIPMSKRLRHIRRTWIVRNNDGNIAEEKMSSLYADALYMEKLRSFLRYLGNIAKEHSTQLILLYHPINYNVDENGNLTFDDETDEWETFQSLCEESNIIAVSTKDEYIRMFHEQHVVPNGFSNTKLGAGHINEYGHTAMANVLYETIESLEE